MSKLQNPFTSKSASPLLWDDWVPPVGSEYKKNFRPLANYVMFNDNPTWQNLRNMSDLFDCYNRNPIFFAIVNIKAREYSNMCIKVVNRRTGKVEPENTLKAIPKMLYALYNRPNVLQSRWEFLQQRKIFEEVGGNSFTYGNFGLGMRRDYSSISALWNVFPALMEFKLAGKYFEATEISDVIKEWRFRLLNYEKVWEPDEIMHKNKPNTDFRDGLIFGRSPALSLYRPLTNIDMAYESRNVLMANRGMRLFISSTAGDNSGKIALGANDAEEVNKALKEYGMLEHQKQFFFSRMPLNATPIDQDVMKLGLFEEIATDTMTCCHAYGVPEILVKLYIKGATFENQQASVKRLYQGALIPEADDDMIAQNNFLKLDETDWMLVASFDHVPAMQEDKKIESDREAQKKSIAMQEYGKGLITRDEYREEMGYGAYPDQSLEPTVETEPVAE